MSLTEDGKCVSVLSENMFRIIGQSVMKAVCCTNMKSHYSRICKEVINRLNKEFSDTTIEDTGERDELIHISALGYMVAEN